MNRAIELHDSEIECATMHGTEVHVRFSVAYVHDSDGKPGIDDGTGWFQRAIFKLKSAELVLPEVKWPLRIYDGSLVVADTTYPNMIPIPLNGGSKIRLTIQGHEKSGNGEWKEFSIVGYEGSVELEGNRESVEVFSRRPT